MKKMILGMVGLMVATPAMAGVSFSDNTCTLYHAKSYPYATNPAMVIVQNAELKATGEVLVTYQFPSAGVVEPDPEWSLSFSDRDGDRYMRGYHWVGRNVIGWRVSEDDLDYLKFKHSIRVYDRDGEIVDSMPTSTKFSTMLNNFRDCRAKIEV